MVYLVWIHEGFVGDRILCAYYDKFEAEAHCDRLNSMTSFLDEYTYTVKAQEVQ